MALRLNIVAVILFGLSGCDDESMDDTFTFSLGGSVETYELDLAGGLVLQNNGENDLLLPANAISGSFPRSFLFDDELEDGATYSITVLKSPDAQICDVTDGVGTVAGADVSNITVRCQYTALEVVSTSPVDEATMDADDWIYIHFSYPIDIDSVALAGTLGALDPIFSEGVYPGRLAVHAPTDDWPSGPQTLVVDVNGETGIPLQTLTLNYTME